MPAPATWDVPVGRVGLASGEIHVWRAPIDVPAARLARCEALLSPDERAREQAFYFDRDRFRYAAARGWLRELLGGYLEEDPARLTLRYGPQGKPALDGTPPSALWFNLAHSRDVALLAVTRARELGVDVERVQDDFPCLEIAHRFFTKDETAWIAAAPAGGVPDRFFVLWTRKEAYIKALGGGLSIPLDSVDVREPPAGWSIVDLPVGGGFKGAVAWQSRAAASIRLLRGPDGAP